MPVTPFHFGVGLLCKGGAPARVSLGAFILSQVLIDLESGYFLFVAREWPVHRWAHTFALSALIGLGAGVIACLGARVVTQGASDAAWSSEVGLWPAMTGGLLGGLTHPLLDGLMHADIRPFLPLSEENPLLGLIGLAELHLFCVGAGLTGLVLLGARRLGREAGDRGTDG